MKIEKDAYANQFGKMFHIEVFFLLKFYGFQCDGRACLSTESGGKEVLEGGAWGRDVVDVAVAADHLVAGAAVDAGGVVEGFNRLFGFLGFHGLGFGFGDDDGGRL